MPSVANPLVTLQPPVSHPNPVVTQMALVKLNKSQNRRKGCAGCRAGEENRHGAGENQLSKKKRKKAAVETQNGPSPPTDLLAYHLSIQ